MSIPVHSNCTPVGSEKFSTVKAQDKNFNVLVTNTFKDLGEVMNKPLNEICENTNN